MKRIIYAFLFLSFSVIYAQTPDSSKICNSINVHSNIEKNNHSLSGNDLLPIFVSNTNNLISNTNNLITKTNNAITVWGYILAFLSMFVTVVVAIYGWQIGGAKLNVKKIETKITSEMEKLESKIKKNSSYFERKTSDFEKENANLHKKLIYANRSIVKSLYKASNLFIDENNEEGRDMLFKLVQKSLLFSFDDTEKEQALLYFLKKGANEDLEDIKFIADNDMETKKIKALANQVIGVINNVQK